MIQTTLNNSLSALGALLPKLESLAPALQKLADAMLAAWKSHHKVLIAGNGGSAADSMHFAEELVVRYKKNRRALAAIALCDPSVLTCAGNDFGYESIFARQVEALGNPGDILIIMTTSGNSPNLLRAAELARQKRMLTASFLGNDGGHARGLCDIELIIPSPSTARTQECHKILYHTICEYIDSRVE
jgi:D-sedoheptulose 7-phosphate isomerase